MSIEKVLFGTLTGLAAGVLIGFLFAPEKGSVTRKKITKQSEDYANVLKNRFDEFIDSVTEKIQETNNIALDTEEKIEKKVKA